MTKLPKILNHVKLGFLITVIGSPLLTILYFVIIDYLSIRVGSTTGCGTEVGFNSCYWSNFFEGATLAFLLAFITIFTSRFKFHKMGTWAEYLFGILYVLLILPINVYIAESMYRIFDLKSVARGEFNDVFIPFMVFLNAMILVLLSLKFPKRNKVANK